MATPPISRRRFLGQASCAAVTGIPILNTLLNLRLSTSVANAVTLPNGTEYRALVCIFLSGGNDSFNMLTPYGKVGNPGDNTFYGPYDTSRNDLALDRATQLIQITPIGAVAGDPTYGVHYRMPNLAARFAAGDAAFIANVGTLIEPVSTASQVNGSPGVTQKRAPLGLYSHSDQIEQWQTSVPHSRSGLGWAGRMMDLIKNVNPNPVTPMNISIDGSNIWQTGETGAEYAVAAGGNQVQGGAIALDGYSEVYDDDGDSDLTNIISSATYSMLARQYKNLLQRTYQKKRKDALETYAVYSAATAGTLPGSISFPTTPLGYQLRQVAQGLMGHAAMNARRQTFFVNRGGWDHHSDLLNSQHAMLYEVDQALHAFWQQLVALGMQDEVVIFSASDFGRSLSSNSGGSDHAWGGNQFVMGGKVKGGKIYGEYPDLTLGVDNPLDTGSGRLVPTTSCDEFFAEMALWLGVPATDLPLILPNIGNFMSGGNTTLNFLE